MKLVKSFVSCSAPENVVMTFVGRTLSIGEQVTILVGIIRIASDPRVSYIFSSKCLDGNIYLKMDFNFEDDLVSLTFQPDNYECL